MFHVLRHADRPQSASRTIKFEGRSYGTDVSFFAVDNDPGQGPDLHVHPYPETWIIRAGQAEFNVDGKKTRAGAGDILVVEAGVPHGFKNVGDGRLDVVCIHASDHVIQEWV
ncbi:cupin domain-containing protein [Chelativorans salis]|uniref:Cupin domain-containing protein n=1 Tax=Chelativorans salis TaxID=2978478 RepID=A0ABT2LPU7_9HYPH|nr:cupin domain-containing protein [Chelativorans sp. EGI FJ00035]MCT7376582.1 cupin domain-containing protein [Chelativorans sp. EGI FJ00035]